MKHWERLETEGRLAEAWRTLRKDGLSQHQIREIMHEEKGVTEQELYLMVEHGWTLHNVRETIRDAHIMGLITFQQPPHWWHQEGVTNYGNQEEPTNEVQDEKHNESGREGHHRDPGSERLHLA